MVPAGPGLPDGLVIPAAELIERFSRSSGPGGQGVNTTDSRVELVFEPGRSVALTPVQAERLTAAWADDLVNGGLRLVASERRSQLRNRAAARERLVALIRGGLAPPSPPRRPTRPTRGSQRRRLEAKRRRGQTKSRRGPVADD